MKLQILLQLKEQVVEFLDQLVQNIPDTESVVPDLILARVLINDQIETEKIMDYIIEEILPLRQKIIDKDDDFFLKNNILFSKFSENKVNQFKNLWEQDILDQHDRNTIWEWFRVFIHLADQYQQSTE